MKSSIFLSYTKTDLNKALKIKTLFEEREVQVFFNQDNDYLFENWPKTVGESIANQTSFMLVWSEHAAKSPFIEFEWNTALALKKKIFPVLMDDFSLPGSLASIEAIPYELLSVSADKIKEEIKRIEPPQVGSQKEVVGKLNKINTTSPRSVVSEVRSIYQQEGYTEKGNIYQVYGENINIHNPSRTSSNSKRWYERWQTYTTLIAGILGVVVILLDMPRRWKEAFPPEMKNQIEMISLKGIILNADNNAISGAIVKLNILPGDSAVTTSDGGFIFKKVPGEIGDDVRVYVNAEGYQSLNEYKTLPGPIELRLKKLEHTR